jgi:hypothetical protein
VGDNVMWHRYIGIEQRFERIWYGKKLRQQIGISTDKCSSKIYVILSGTTALREQLVPVIDCGVATRTKPQDISHASNNLWIASRCGDWINRVRPQEAD